MRRVRWTGIYALALAVVVFVRAALWITRYQRIRSALVRPCPEDPQTSRRATVARITRAVARIARFIPDASCLTQTISCQAMLSWKGIPSTITMGLKKDSNGVFKAHAWLSWDGQVVLEGDEGTLLDFNKILDLPTPVRAPASP
ncbi:lasso peptide biosynthesis B2 protein [uncultured Roseobacter sp.]|uniref:lasso peptide biosynthesis B2 protein n=1 Tax=uncultured Roseobacter sp. TaxID=114847 RepID=UPI00262D87D4|nr:lasso peptide biosynthesis B2 protein [uncultured Roseobacter sp.]